MTGLAVDSEDYDAMLLKYKNGELTEADAREFFGENFEEATGTVIAIVISIVPMRRLRN